jgi:hypothetical protein
LHLGLTREQKEAAIAAGEAHQHPYAPHSGAVELYLERADQLPTARRLAHLALDRAAAMATRFPAGG